MNGSLSDYLKKDPSRRMIVTFRFDLESSEKLDALTAFYSRQFGKRSKADIIRAMVQKEYSEIFE